MKIKIEKEPYAVDKWFSGTYKKDVGDELEYKEKIYEFTIFSGESENINSNLFITWVDDTPENNEEIEKQILEQFNKSI